MKSFGIWVLLMIALVFLACTSSRFSAGLATPVHVESLIAITNRKLKESSISPSSGTKEEDLADVNLEDYRLIDPVPTSKNEVKAVPIEHGVPLMPYIPQPMPPQQPKHGGSP